MIYIRAATVLGPAKKKIGKLGGRSSGVEAHE